MAFCDTRDHVFIVGSARSGTSLMASILQTSPLYASYRAETKLLDGCHEKYGNLNNDRSKKTFWNDWFRSRQFKRSGLTEGEVREFVMPQSSYLAVLGTYMNLVASKQERELWVDSTPGNSYSLKDIAHGFPNAKVIHMVRDGRAVAMSLAKLGWAGVKTTDYNKSLYYSALKWQRVIKAVRMSKYYLNGRYLEINYEQLVQAPTETINDVCQYLNIPNLDSSFKKDRQNTKSTLHTPNTPFGDMTSGISSNAAFRWKSMLDDLQLSRIEAHIGDTLVDLGYPLCSKMQSPPIYRVVAYWRKSVLEAKKRSKQYTILGRFGPTPLEIGLE